MFRRKGTEPNEAVEAYTGNHIARKGDLSADRQAAIPEVLI